MARRMEFKTRALESLRPGPTPYEVRESGGADADGNELRGTGLRLRVSPTGVKSFRWPCRALNKVFTLGTFGDGTGGTITLAQAHAKLEELRVKHAAGTLVDGDDAEAERDRPRSVADLIDLFVESLAVRRKRPEAAKHALDNYLRPALGRLPLVALDTLACRKPIQRLVTQKHPRSAAVALALLKQLLGYGCELGVLDRNVAAPLKASSFGILKVERKRWLTADELVLVLKAIDASDMDEASKLGLRLLVFTGLRTAELLTLEWSDVDEGDEKDAKKKPALTIRPENMKMTLAQAEKAEPYVVPLSAPALAAVKRLRELESEERPAGAKPRPWVFPSAISKTGRVTDKALCRAMARLWGPRVGKGKRTDLREVKQLDPRLKIPRATPHDFRRTLSTHVSDTLGWAPHVGQLLLGHSLGHLLGSAVAGVYDKAKRLDERRQALDAYAEWVAGLLEGKTAKVVPMGTRRRSNV